MRARRCPISCGVLMMTAYCLLPTGYSGELRSERRIIDANFPGAYQVEVADVNGDKKPDVIAVGGSTCAWYENPSWKKRIVTTGKRSPGIISSTTADLDGDGRAEIAIAYEFAMNEPSKGKLLLAVQGKGLDDPWKLVPIGEIGSIHRLRWGDVDGDKRLDLVVAPLFGPEAKPPTYASPNRIRVFTTGANPESGRWSSRTLSDRYVLHAIEVIDADGDGLSDILTADNDGVALFLDNSSAPRSLTPGAPGKTPKRGSSEVHLGKLRDGRRFLATVEPWHGNEVAVCLADDVAKGPKGDQSKAWLFGPRTVLDETLADGHALWVADVDGDGDDEILAGHRGKDHRVSMYDYDWVKKTWARTVLDRDIAAQDLRGGDLDGDGKPDVIAVGGATHNVVWYHFDGR